MIDHRLGGLKHSNAWWSFGHQAFFYLSTQLNEPSLSISFPTCSGGRRSVAGCSERDIRLSILQLGRAPGHRISRKNNPD